MSVWWWYPVLLVCVMLVISAPQTSAQVAHLGNSTVEAGTRHSIICNVSNYESNELQYEFLNDGTLFRARNEFNEYSFSSVQVEDAGDGYECRVYDGNSNTPLVTARGTLHVTIPQFNVLWRQSPNPSSNYVGLNVQFLCQTAFVNQLRGVSVNLVISGPAGRMLSNTTDGRIVLHETREFGNGDFERIVKFLPLSSSDMGTYSCTGTATPVISNSFVTSGSGSRMETIDIATPTLSVAFRNVTPRVLDVEPYNMYNIICSVDVLVRGIPIPAMVRFNWSIMEGNGLSIVPGLQYITSFSNGGSLNSTLTYPFSMAGDYSISCQVTLDVMPASDNITDTLMQAVTVFSRQNPAAPTELSVPEATVQDDSVIVQWLVPMVTYDNETYHVIYWRDVNNQTRSSLVMGETLIHLVNVTYSVELTGLMSNTQYFYKVTAMNSVGSQDSIIRDFTTTMPRPSPPLNLMARNGEYPNEFFLMWDTPTNPNGLLNLYTLTCSPTTSRIPNPDTLIFNISDKPLETSIKITVMYGVVYNCSVRTKNRVAFSDRSNSVELAIQEREPGVVQCNLRWNNVTRSADRFDIAVSWMRPIRENGLILRYYLRLLSYDGETEIDSASVSADIRSYLFTGQILFAGVPYIVSVIAENTAGNSSESCHMIGFSDQQTPPPVTGLTVTRSGDTIVVKWDVISLTMAMGFLDYVVRYGPPDVTLETERCTDTSCVVVPMMMGGVNITGLSSSSDYVVSVQPFNGENEKGQAVNLTVFVMGESSSSFPLLLVVVGVVVVGAVFIILVVIIIVCLMCKCCRSKKSDYGMRPDTLVDEDNVELNMKEREYITDTELSSDKPPLYTMVTERSRSVPVVRFKYHVQEMHSNRDNKFEKEYESLGNDILAACEIAKMNKAKNRFANIFPYDFSRVKLQPVEGMESADYINASYIDGYKQANAYIAAQGPMINTVGDFWRMVWEHKLSTIIMLTKVNEAGKRKCEQYWPDVVGQSQIQPSTTIEVTLKELMPFADYEIRRFEVQDVSEECLDLPLSVTHYHFIGWPDHGVPKFATSLIEFIRRVRNSSVTSGPILVHCSAGVGRTGTYITLDAMLERMKEDDCINVYEFVRNMRAKRVFMVQTQAQYMFIHDALEELITCGETAIRAPQLRKTLVDLNKVDPNTATTGFEEQFKLLNEVSRKPTDSDCSDALQHYNQVKNRYQDKVPYNTNRIRLRGAEYINASFVDGYKQRNAYIATQSPLEASLTEFWHMIWEFKSRVIVMLCPLQEDGKEASCLYWPEMEGDDLVAGKLLVTLLSEKVEKDFIEKKIKIKEEKSEGTPGRGFVVTHYHYKQWPEHDRPPNTIGLLQMIKSLNSTQRNTGNRPITIICNDGVGRTGSFICIHAMLERVNTENVIDFFQFIKSSRIHRPELVTELEHYRFCHDTLADYLDSLDSYANFKDLSNK